MTGPIFAGIDGGGTKTAFVIVDAEGRQLIRHQETTSNAAVVGHDQAGSTLRTGLRTAIEKLESHGFELVGAWFGLSGSDRPEDQAKLLPHVEDLSPVIRMSNDAELVLGALDDSVGIAVVSGTGSIAYGRNARGGRARSGGWGQIIGDEGSGYDIARRMLDSYAREIDGRGPATTCTSRLASHLELHEPFQIISWVYAGSTSKGDIAALSAIAVEEANAGDEVARQIIRESAHELATTVASAARRLGFSSHLPLALTGGMLLHIDAFREHMLERLRQEWPELDVRMVADPALAAARSLARTVKEGHSLT
jgi:N-acetylglucosamine kinase-like BadF-type ATPase